MTNYEQESDGLPLDADLNVALSDSDGDHYICGDCGRDFGSDGNARDNHFMSVDCPGYGLESFLATDQPEACRSCGARATILSSQNEVQICECPECHIKWLVKEDNE